MFSETALAAITITSPNSSTVVPESDDFAVEEFSDPWDFSQSTDYRMEDWGDISSLGVGGGLISGRTIGNDPRFFVHFPGYQDAWPMGRDGMRHPIDTSRYRYLSVRIYSSSATNFQFYWLYNQAWTDFGVKSRSLNAGWNTFNIDLGSDPIWNRKPVGLRIDPATAANIDFKIDWIRLHRAPIAANNINIIWNDSAPGGNADLYLDNDANPGNGDLGLITSRPSNASNSWTWDSSDWPAGKYYIFVKKSGVNSLPTGSFEIRSPSLIQILDPDEKGGEDYATAALGDPWDMNSLSDLYLSLNIQNLSANGVLSGALLNDDPNFYLKVGPPINTDRYHRVNFSMAYDRFFDFGLGSMSRFMWNPNGLDVNAYQTSDDIVTYPQWTEYTFDLETMKLDAGSIGWNGHMTTFRFDPLEAFPPSSFWIDYIYLRADDEATTNFPIKWQELGSSLPPSTVSIYYDTDNQGYDGTLIAQNIAQTGNINTYNWDVTQVESGLYYIYIVTSDGVTTGRHYSTGPVRITTPNLPRWYIRKAITGGFESVSAWSTQWGKAGDIQLTGNFDGDLYDDIAIYRPTGSSWFVKRSNGSGFDAGTSWSTSWGNSGTEKPLVGDFDGDGKSDIAIYRAGSYPNWFFKLSSGSGFAPQSYPLSWGNAGGDTPIVGDFNGDGKSDIGIYRKGSYPNWFIRLSSSSGPGNVSWGQVSALSWGNAGGDTPIVGNFNGDKFGANGIDDIGIYRTGSYPNWFFLRTKADGTGFMAPQNTWSVNWGNAGGDIPIVGDFGGDGKSDIGIFRISGYPNWFTNNANGSGFDQQTDTSSSWGNLITDRPVIGDFSGDGMDDLGIYRP